MVVALTDRQWSAFKQVTDMGGKLTNLGHLLDRDLDQPTQRYEAREAIEVMLRPWFAARSFTEVSRIPIDGDVAWGPYQALEQLVREDDRCSPVNRILEYVHQPSAGRTLAAREPLRWAPTGTPSPRPAPALGQHTDEILTTVLGLSDREVELLRQRAVGR